MHEVGHKVASQKYSNSGNNLIYAFIHKYIYTYICKYLMSEPVATKAKKMPSLSMTTGRKLLTATVR